MTDSLAVRIRHRLRFVESHHDRQLFVQCLEVLEGEGFVPKVVHPDGTGDPANVAESRSGVAPLNPDTVIRWLEENGVRQLPWQLQRLGRL